jgi:hypothetical protein
MNLSDFDMKIDTALSYEGTFPEPQKNCYAVGIEGAYGYQLVLVSSRYTSAIDFADAAEIAVDHFDEYGDELAVGSRLAGYHVEVWKAIADDDRHKVRGIVRLSDCGNDWEFTTERG